MSKFMGITAEEDQRFKSAVKRSRKEVLKVESYFLKLGCSTRLPDVKIRDKFDDRAGFGDDADLFVLGILGDSIGVEVKGRTLNFTSCNDFPYQTIFVDRVVKADMSTVKCYISLNSAGTHMAVVMADTKNKWVKSTRYDNVKGHNLTVYECPKHLIKFIKLKS